MTSPGWELACQLQDTLASHLSLDSFMRSINPRIHVDLARFAAAHTHDQGLVGHRDEHLATEFHPANPVGGRHNRLIQVEAPLILLNFFVAREFQMQVTQWLIGTLQSWITQHFSAEFFRFRDFTGENEAAQFCQMLSGFRIGVIVRQPSPKRAFIQLQPFLRRAPENHGPQSSITYGQGLLPFHGRLIIPKKSCRPVAGSSCG